MLYPASRGVNFRLDFLSLTRIIAKKSKRPNSLVVKHVLGKDESQVRFLLRAPCDMKHLFGCFLLLILPSLILVYVKYRKVKIF